ncbi:hypothetical protein H5410_036915 [Solanum commersonii]|uniref:Uncharacterized protein n=1 Tax=Solanum commersonii TaxID=4109 RepID=A0A9J5Y4U3_SOLCO|nr:hypothetical protein H5410_036915 [Solanum commersonii]
MQGDSEIEEHSLEQVEKHSPSVEQSESIQSVGTICQDTNHFEERTAVDNTKTSQGLTIKSYRYQGSHPIYNVLTDLTFGITTRSGLKNLYAFQEFVSMVGPKKVKEALLDEDWIQAKQEELNQFERSKMASPSHSLFHRLGIFESKKYKKANISKKFDKMDANWGWTITRSIAENYKSKINIILVDWKNLKKVLGRSIKMIVRCQDKVWLELGEFLGEEIGS